MRIFLDANILVAVLNKEYPVFTYAARILSLADKPRYKIYTSPICLAIAFYFSEKKSGRKAAKEKIKTLVSHIGIAETGEDEVLQTISNRKSSDFENGLEYYAALASKCDVIITEDVTDYFFADIDVQTSNGFFEKYLKANL
ncbi:MAG TPA: PIN domain-containing protein [Chitinophagaceae bacterium]|nr:PIN domain-containing protein [Chitinophagaceae bacterium]